ncbi:MAG: hypothetical protein PHG97_05780 [Candidatus Margulisbacteria bacterium]|nr:hypothetical protein [Candidatus Margulisiibacteriota bacterium]
MPNQLKKIEVNRLSAAIAARLKISLHSSLSTLRRNLETLGRQQHLSLREQHLLSRIIRLEILLREAGVEGLTRLPKTQILQQIHEFREILKAARKNAAPEMARLIAQVEKAADQFEAITKASPKVDGAEIKSITFDRDLIRLQIEINRPLVEDHESESFRIEIAVPREVIEQEVVRDKILPEIPRELMRIEGNSELAEIFGRVMASDLGEKIVREIVRETRETGRLTSETVERAVARVEQEKPLAKIYVVKGSSLDIAELPKELDADRRPAAVRVIVNERPTEKGVQVESLRIEIKDRADKTIIIEEVRSQPAEKIKEIIEAAVKIAAGEPERTPVLADTVAAVLREALGEAPKPIAPAIAAKPVNDNPKAAAEAKKPAIRPAAEAIKVLTAAYSTAVKTENAPARALLEAVILNFVATPAGRQLAVKSVIDPKAAKELSLTIPEINDKVVVEVAKSLLSQKGSDLIDGKVIKQALTGADKAARLQVISRLIAAENNVKVADALTVATAKKFVELTARVQQIFELVREARKTSKLSRRNNRVASAVSPAASQFASHMSSRRPAVQGNTRSVKQITEIAKSIKALSTFTKEAEYILPKSLIAEIQAALSVNNLIPAQPVTPGTFTPAYKPVSNHLNYYIQALESQLANVQAVSRAAARSAEKLAALSTQVLLYGTLMRLVSGEITNVDALIKQLKEMKGFDELINDLENNPDLAIETLNRPVLAGRVSRIRAFKKAS